MFTEIMHYLIKDLMTVKRDVDPDLWLIAERGNDAQDNGFHLYCYILNHQELGITPVYLITRQSPDYEKVKNQGGRTVEPGSREHYELMYSAGALISTHPYGFTPDMDVYHRMAEYGLFSPPGLNVFLQHGITDKDDPSLHREVFRPDVFVTSSDSEKELVLNTFHQPAECLANIGMCRYDRLAAAGKPQKRILVMATWREWLKGLSKTEFLETDYAKRWRTLLFDKNFIFELSKAGYKLVFYMHPELKEYIHLFTHEGIEIATDNLQTQMLKSEILITDYSSIYFDMAYMHRNVVFWQFDNRRYSTEQYNGLTLDYNRFGYLARDCGDVKRAVLECIAASEVSSTKIVYGDEEFIYDFFSHHDANQCARTIDILRAKQILHKQG